ncbi:MAG: hypothetical protein H7X95_01650 [Deltaproteobacteria bacterium]|nr:hypothetical protein [Deltaproteobacteria bacterium]
MMNPASAPASNGRAPQWGVALVAIIHFLSASACDLPPSSQSAGSQAAPGAATARALGLLVAPDDDTAPMLEAIRGARRRVLVEMYMLTAPDAVSALLAARDAGVDVRVLLEPTPYGDGAANQPAFAILAAAGVDVRWAHRGDGLVHAKLIVVDGRVGYVMTLNLTAAGLGTNREFVVIDRDPAEIRLMEQIWNADAVGADVNVDSAATASGVATRVLVSPLEARARLGACIDAARASIRLEMEELSDADLVARLAAAHARSVAVSIVAPASNRSAATTAALRKLAMAGVSVRVLGVPNIHAKAMVVDESQIYVGSINFTRSSLDANREVGLLWNDGPTARRLGATIAADAAAGLPFSF